MRCIGLDLAWGRKNTTGAVCLELLARGGQPQSWRVCAHSDSLGDDEDVLSFVREYQQSPGGKESNYGDGCVVAIDAPTLVPNETGRRPAEAECQLQFGRYQAGPHPANRSRYKGDIRGEIIARELVAKDGYAHDPAPPRVNERRVMEVFPHPAHVALFNLSRTLKYKAKPGRTLTSRLAEFDRYEAYLRALEHADPALLPDDSVLTRPGDPTLAALKRYEDRLDALTCAYIAAYYIRWGAKRVQVLGDMTTGHIVVPRLQYQERRAL